MQSNVGRVGELDWLFPFSQFLLSFFVGSCSTPLAMKGFCWVDCSRPKCNFAWHGPEKKVPQRKVVENSFRSEAICTPTLHPLSIFWGLAASIEKRERLLIELTFRSANTSNVQLHRLVIQGDFSCSTHNHWLLILHFFDLLLNGRTARRYLPAKPTARPPAKIFVARNEQSRIG